MSTPNLQTLPSTAGTDDILEILRKDGALILKDALTPGLVDTAVGELTPYVNATQNGRDAFTGYKTTRTGALVARSAAARDLVTHPVIMDACKTFLAPFCERVQIHLTQVIRIKPGQDAQKIHRDRWAWGTHLKDLEPQFNTIWALTDFTRENGATQVVPGSLEWPDNRQPTPDEIAYAEMSRGSVLVYTGGVFHGGGANVSDHERMGVNITYTLGWLRQEENQYLSCPPEIARTFSPELQNLLGYTMGGYAMGYYTPPVGPGEGPEIVGPEFALGRSTADSTLGENTDLVELEKAVAN